MHIYAGLLYYTQNLAGKCYDKSTRGMLPSQTFALAVSSAWNGFSHIHKTHQFFSLVTAQVVVFPVNSSLTILFFHSNTLYPIPASYTYRIFTTLSVLFSPQHLSLSNILCTLFLCFSLPQLKGNSQKARIFPLLFIFLQC